MTFKCSLTLQCFVILIEVGRGSECGEIFFSFLQVFKGRERWGGLDLIFHLDNIILPLCTSNVLLSMKSRFGLAYLSLTLCNPEIIFPA